MKKAEQTQAFLENALEAATKIRDICHIFGGYGDESSPEDGLLGKVYDCVAEMISIYLEPITGKELYSDDLNGITCEAMYINKEEISDFIRKYCTSSV